jgi:hypothetical protein
MSQPARRAIAKCAVAAVAVVVVYPLSFGPAAAMNEHGLLSVGTARFLEDVVYAPLLWAYTNSSGFGAFMDAYLVLWAW